MCGVAGFFARIDNQSGQEVLASMSSLLRHRGPDAQDRKLIDLGDGRKIGLAHSLLSIIGKPGEGRQPFEVPGGTLVFNGAIYNFAELREKLKSQGLQFRTSTDTEVLAQGLGFLGHEFLKDVRGMYAFAFWDSRKKRLLLARDPYGVKPLYIYHSAGVLGFASEYKALLPHIHNLSLREASVYDFLRYRYVPGRDTMYSNISKLPQGVVTEFDPYTGNILRHRYFEEDPSRIRNTEIPEILDTAIRRRAVADVDVGALLSGGIDSGFVCDVLQKSVHSLHTYTLAMNDRNIDESEIAQKISEKIGSIHTTIHPKTVTVEDIGRMIYHLDDPYGDPIVIALDQIFSSISGKQRVIVTGEGADEIFSGYVHHRAAGFLDRVPRPLLSSFSLALNVTPTAMLRLLLPYAGKMSDYDFKQAIARLTRMIGSRDLASFQSIFYLFDDSSLNQTAADKAVVQSEPSNLNSVRKWDYLNWLPDSQLFKLDKLSMASSIEAREPFVDQDLIAAVNALPPNSHFSVRRDKPIFRDSIKSKVRLPQEIVRSRKSSFFQPFDRTTTSTLAEDLADTIRSEKDFLESFVRGPVLADVLSSRDTGLLAQKRLFALGTLALWNSKVRTSHSKGVQLANN